MDTTQVGEHLAPFGKGAICSDNGAFLLVAATDQLGMTIGVGQIADLITLLD
jgi:hypothetical protein